MKKNRRCFWMTAIVTGVTALVAIAVTAAVLGLSDAAETNRTFTIDHVNNQFLMNGENFRYVSGTFHYFRALPQVWRDRLKTMRQGGLNVLDTYVEWSLHNPKEGVYEWSGIADVERFIEIAAEEGFYVILRPGPYICAERDNGGLPHWLFRKYPNINLRTSDENYSKEVSLWYSELMPRLSRFLYGNGGPIIMVQVENEYGTFPGCDVEHKKWLRDETDQYVKGNALLFTVDIPDEGMSCGKIDGVFATTDFGIERIHEIDDIWKMLRALQPTGPLVNSEFYPGWLTHWQEKNQRRDPQLVADALDTILSYGASVNFYMFFGGTNFGFTAGANNWGYGLYQADITSYDYDACMDEAGGTTEKFHLVRNVIAKYMDVPALDESIAKVSVGRSYGKVQLTPITRLLSDQALNILTSNTIKSQYPQTFEALDLYSGLVLYEADLPELEIDPTLLTVNELRDRAFVFVDKEYVGTLSRENAIFSLPLHAGWGSKLQLLVENQGRINFEVLNDTKGIFGDVTIQTYSGSRQPILQWTSTGLPLDVSQIQSLVELHKSGSIIEKVPQSTTSVLRNGPVLYHAEFTITETSDTYLNVQGWGKGVAYINDLNLGRYWPLVGPQVTLYVPKDALKVGVNTLVLLEYQKENKLSTGNIEVQFDADPQIDA